MKVQHWTLVAVALALASTQAFAISKGNLDDFEDDTTQGWKHGNAGSPNPPINVPSGGDGGAEDGYLENFASGASGPGGRQAMINTDPRWVGDYIAAGVNKIRVNIANFGLEPENVRVGFLRVDLDCWVSTDAAMVPADGMWRNFEFLITDDTMTQAFGDGNFGDALSDVQQIRFVSNTDQSCIGVRRESILGYDDIQSDGDADLDGINDGVDNCTEVANPRVCIDPAGFPALAFTDQASCEGAGNSWGQPDTDGDSYGNACDPDIVDGPFPGGDCSVNFTDLNRLKAVFFAGIADPEYDPRADANFDGNINFAELNAMKAQFFGAPGPGLGNCGCAPDIASDQGVNADFAGLKMFVRGSLILDWGAVDGISNFVDLGEGAYQARVQLNAGNYQYKVADLDWNIDYANEVDTTTPGGPAVTLNGRCGSDTFCAPSVPDPGQGNSAITIAEPGCYQFDMVAGPPDDDEPFEADTVDVTVTGPLP